MSETDDRRLVRAFVDARDEQSFLGLYRAHTPVLYRMAWRLGGLSPADVDDVIQETWVRAAARIDGFRFESSLRTWLIGILIRCGQESRRASARADRPAPISVEVVTTPTPGLAIDLERAIAALPDGMREVFLLFDVEGLTHEEVARCLGVTPGTSKSQLFAARQRLRLGLGRTGHGT